MIGIGTDNPSAKLHVEGLSSLSTTLDVGGISLSDTDTITYPTTSSFQVTAGNSVNIELGTSQTVTSGFNFVTADKRTYTKSAGTTSDIERLYFAGFNQSFNWTDANTCKQYVSFSDSFIYQGINANGRSSSAFNVSGSIRLDPPDGGTQSIANVTSPVLFIDPTGISTVNVTNYKGYAPLIRLASLTAGTKTVNITNAHFYDTHSVWGSVVNSGTLDATITNLYGLRLRPPNNTTGLTVTNNYGVYQEWSDATNYFAGNVGINITDPTEKLEVDGTVKATDFNTTSDENLKTNIHTIEDPLAKVAHIRGVNFEWKENNKRSAGVIAQEVEKVLPELINGEQTKTVNYNGLIGLLIEVVKEQQIQIDSLNGRLSRLE